MGTNYYYEEPDRNHCEHCGRCDKGERLHIGKSSVGWVFALHVTDEIQSLEDWERKWQGGGRIVNEYGDELTPVEMRSVITERGSESGGPGPWYKSWDEFHAQNHSEAGPNNLARSRIDGHHCIGHGSGTWDLIRGEFS